jgi:electron transport complex protein RnfG
MKEIIRLCLVLTVIAAVSAAVLAFVEQTTREPIAEALKAEEMAAIRSVLPPFDNEADKDTLTLSDEASSYKFYLGRSEGVIIGAAFAVVAPNGYSGDIKVMVGVDTAGVVQGIEILNHRETPGLGAKIQTAEFRGQYEGKSLSDPEVWDVVKDGGTFRQITGATISSRAVTHCIARALEFFSARRSEILGRGKGTEAPESAGEENRR